MNPIKLILEKVDKLRIWGIKGAFNYLVRICSPDHNRKFLLKNAARYPMTPTRGITLLADMTQRSSLSKVMRDLAAKLKKAGIPFQAYDLGDRADIPSADHQGLLTRPDEFRLLKYDHVITMSSSPLPRKLPLTSACIVFWEFTTGLLEYDPKIAEAKTIIGMSDFDVEVFRNLLPATTKVEKLLYPFMLPPHDLPDPQDVRKRYSLEANEFIVFFNFDYGSSFNRKNPDGAMRAFANAFAETPNVRLVFKTKGAASHKKEHRRLRDLAKELGIDNRFTSIDDFIPMADIYGLTAACDVYISLHRGEGFGLGVAEAMSLGKPVVVTDYSSTTEFCNRENSIPIPYRLVDVPRGICDNPCYAKVKSWADPDINAAAAALRDLYDHLEKRQRIGASARQFIAGHFSPENFNASIKELLNVI